MPFEQNHYSQAGFNDILLSNRYYYYWYHGFVFSAYNSFLNKAHPFDTHLFPNWPMSITARLISQWQMPKSRVMPRSRLLHDACHVHLDTVWMKTYSRLLLLHIKHWPLSWCWVHCIKELWIYHHPLPYLTLSYWTVKTCLTQYWLRLIYHVL